MDMGRKEVETEKSHDSVNQIESGCTSTVDFILNLFVGSCAVL